MNQLKFCLTIVLIIGRSVKADQRSALYQVLPATDSEDEENTIDWILQQPWDQQSVNMSLTKQRISVKFQSMNQQSGFTIPLPIQLSAAKMKVILTSSGQLSGASLEACIDGNNRPLHMNMHLNELNRVGLASMVGGAWIHPLDVNLLPGVSFENINVTTVINAAGVIQIQSTIFPSTLFQPYEIDVRQSKYISIGCTPSCNLQIDFQKLQ